MNETSSKKKGFSTLDVLIVFGIVVIVLGMIGQNVAVHLVKRHQTAELFEVSFVVRSYGVDEAEALIAAQQKSAAGLPCFYEEKQIGALRTVKRVDIANNGEQEGVHLTLCDLTGTVSVYGRQQDGSPVLYGCGEVKVGDILLISVEKRMVSMEITAVNVKKNEKPT